MGNIRWQTCGNKGFIALLEDRTLLVDRDKQCWEWKVVSHGTKQGGSCRTPNGAKAAATFYAKRHP